MTLTRLFRVLCVASEETGTGCSICVGSEESLVLHEKYVMLFDSPVCLVFLAFVLALTLK
jgi:hypothetical protein